MMRALIKLHFQRFDVEKSELNFMCQIDSHNQFRFFRYRL